SVASPRISDMRNRPRLAKFAAVFIGAIEALSLTAEGQSPSPANGSAKASDLMLPHNIVIPLSTVNHFFPEVTREASTGHNLTSVANPKATRSDIYTNSDSAKKVTVTVDQYATATAALSAYQEAVAKSKTVPGFKAVPADNLGQNAFTGTVTQGGETHIGLGATRHADRWSNPGRVRSHTRKHSQAHLPNPGRRTRCQSRSA